MAVIRAITRSKPRKVGELVSQSFAVSLWPKAVRCYLSLAYSESPLAEIVVLLGNKNLLVISIQVKKCGKKLLAHACVKKHVSVT